MSGQDDALALLGAITDFADPHIGAGYVPSESRPPRIGTVDPAYAGATTAKITFDGEATLSVKAYPFLGVKPAASDRVALLPVGRSYLILGKIGVGAWYDALVAADVALDARLDALEAARLVRIRASATMASSGSIATMTFGTSVLNNGSFSYSGGTFTCVTAGTYKVTASAAWATSGVGVRSLRLAHSGGPTRDSQQAAAGFGHNIVLMMVEAFTVGQTILVSAQQNSGGNLAVTGEIEIERVV